MKTKGKRGEKYLENKLGLIRAVVAGSIIGATIWGRKEDVIKHTDHTMKLIERDVRNIFNYAKKLS